MNYRLKDEEVFIKTDLFIDSRKITIYNDRKAVQIPLLLTDEQFDNFKEKMNKIKTETMTFDFFYMVVTGCAKICIAQRW